MAQPPAPDACQAGTLAYMSPDQLLGDALGPASDIFSLGVVFYEMLTNRLPHAGTTVAQLRTQRLLRPPTPVHWLRPIVPRALGEVVARSEEHTSELSHSQISYAVFCLKKKTTKSQEHPAAPHSTPSP